MEGPSSSSYRPSSSSVGRPPKEGSYSSVGRPPKDGHSSVGRTPQGGGYSATGRPPKEFQMGRPSKEGYSSVGRPPKEAQVGRPPKEGSSSVGRPPKEGSSQVGRPPKDGYSSVGRPPKEGSSSVGRPPKEGYSQVGRPPKDGYSSAGRPPKEGSSQVGRPPKEGNSSAGRPPKEASSSQADRPSTSDQPSCSTKIIKEEIIEDEKEESTDGLKLSYASRLENHLFDIVCYARKKGLFTRIPPCYSKARRISDEIIEFIDKHKYAAIQPEGKEAIYELIDDLETVKQEKLNKRPGYKRLMQALRDEFDSYSTLAEYRGLEEKGELFQFIAHYTKIGHILQHVTAKYANHPPFRYEGVLEKLPKCDHKQPKQKPKQTEAMLFMGSQRLLPCEDCLHTVYNKYEDRLDIMDRIMRIESSPALLVDTFPQLRNFEKNFKIAQKNVTFQSDYVQVMDSIRKICGNDLDGVKAREKMFQLRLRQQKLTTIGKALNTRDYFNEWEEVGVEIDATAVNIVELNEKTKKSLDLFREKMQGSFEMVRANLGTPSGLFTSHPTIHELEERIDEQDNYIAELQRQLKQERAKNAKKDKEVVVIKTPTKTYKKRDRDDDDDDYKPHKRDRDYKPKKTYNTLAKRMRKD